MQAFLFRNATVFTGSQFLQSAQVRVANGRITDVTTEPTADASADEEIVDLTGDYLTPGLIDLQLYGGSQLFLNDIPTPDTVRHIYNTHAQNGTTTLLPTVHSTSLDVMQQAMAAVQSVRAENPFGVPGIHLEGPYFNPIKRGAHSPAYVRTPAPGELEALFSQNADAIRILTLAPEMLTNEQLAYINTYKHADTRLSLGHSNATYRQATDAFTQHQIPLATHLYNAMRGYESREPGVVGAIFDHPTVYASIIADGYHCDPATIRIAHRLLGPERLFLISDALFAHPPRPDFALGQFVVHYQPASESTAAVDSDAGGYGCYVNDEGKLAGSAVTLADCVRTAVERAGLPLAHALRMATQTPADAAGLGGQLGRIEPGYVANFVRFDKALMVKQVWRI